MPLCGCGHSYEFVSLLHTNLEKRVGGARGRVDMGTTDMTTGRRAATTALMPAVLLAALLPHSCMGWQANTRAFTHGISILTVRPSHLLLLSRQSPQKREWGSSRERQLPTHATPAIVMPSKQKKQTTIRLHMGERLASGDAWEALEHWAKAKGMTWSSWKVGEVNGIRGAVSTRSIKAGQVLVRAPRESVLLVTQKQPSPLPPEFIDAAYWEEMSGYWNIRMALLLLYEKRLGAASSWQAYLDVLPASFSTPLTWRDEELAHLQFVPFIDELRVERSYFAYEAQRMRQYMPSPVSQEEMFWALSCVGSRTFTALMGGDAAYDGTAMCPIADMVNHNDASAPAFRWDEEDQAFELFAPADVGEGEEVCISYGQVNNAHLLHFYGFIPGANCHDSLPVTEEEVQTAARQLDARDGVVSEALEALRRGVLQYLVDPGGSVPGLSLPLKKLSDTWRKDSEETATDAYLTRIPGHAFNIGGGGAICLEFVLYCRLWALREEDTKRSAGTWVLDELSIAKLLQGGRDVSPQHAARSRELMLRALGNQLASMPTSYEDDAAIAARIQQGSPPEGWHGSTDNLMLALRYRMAHKSLLLDALASLS